MGTPRGFVYTFIPSFPAADGGRRPLMVVAFTGSESMSESPTLWWKYNAAMSLAPLREDLYGTNAGVHRGFASLNTFVERVLFPVPALSTLFVLGTPSAQCTFDAAFVWPVLLRNCSFHRPVAQDLLQAVGFESARPEFVNAGRKFRVIMVS